MKLRTTFSQDLSGLKYAMNSVLERVNGLFIAQEVQNICKERIFDVV